MHSPISFLFIVLLLLNSLCIQVLARRYPCDDLLARKEWRNMNTDEKLAYVKAVKCLQSKPAIQPPYRQAVSRFDEFQGHYMKQADNVQSLGQSLPWHRHFLRTYEKALRTECGYKGANPYWDWSQDADSTSSISAAPVFDPTTGFGGAGAMGSPRLPIANLIVNNTLPVGNLTVNSTLPLANITAPLANTTAPLGNITANNGTISLGNVTTTNNTLPFANVTTNRTILARSSSSDCVRSGPFANYLLNVGPGKLTTHHCLTRAISDAPKKTLRSLSVASLSKASDFEAFRKGIQVLFEGGKSAVGGEMSDTYSSPGDPLFYLHIANIDRIWWNWQLLAPATRFFSISGPASKVPPVHQVGPDYVLHMGSTGLSVPIRDTMDLWSKPNCFAYV